jgi:hypothetical protein
MEYDTPQKTSQPLVKAKREQPQDKARQDSLKARDHHKTRQGKTRQDKTRQDKTRQDKTRQGKTRQDKTRQDKTRQDKTRQDKTRHDKARQLDKATSREDNRKARQGKALEISKYTFERGRIVTFAITFYKGLYSMTVSRHL